MQGILRRVICLIMAIILSVPSLILSTYAWQSEQSSPNIIIGKGKSVPVQLIKLDKETENPIAGAVFYLFYENGEQIGGRYVTDENGEINLKLKSGDYYFEEVIPSIGYTYDEADGEKITKYPFTVNTKNEVIVVKAYNIRLTDSLLIYKIVENKDGSPLTNIQQKTLFEFTVTFSDNGTYNYRIDNGEEIALSSGETLQLASGQTAAFDNIPVGVLYNVTETPVEGYETRSTGHQGNITDTGSMAVFINRCDPVFMGSLTVTKETLGENADPNKEFGFTAVIGDITESFVLKSGESITFEAIPIGTEFIVTEDDYSADGYFATVKEYSGQIVGDERVTLPFVNVYDDDVPDGKIGSITVTKEVIGENVDPDKIFTFDIYFEGENAPESETFTLKAGESKSFENIPHGTVYYISETDSAEYEAVLNTVSGIVAGEHTVQIEFINRVPDEPEPDEFIELTVTKILNGEVVDSDYQREFEFVLIVDGVETEFTLKANETIEFEIPVGSVYEVREKDYFADGFVQSVVNGAGTAGDDTVNVYVSNTYVDEPMIEISGEKTWVIGEGANVNLPEAITVQLNNGDVLVEEKTVMPDENGLWTYTFIAPKYNPDGTEAVYTLLEVPVKGFIPFYDGYDIVNTYVEPIAVDPPIIRKVVQGENVPETAFEFVFSGEDGAPMPEGSEGTEKLLTLTGAGELEIGSISFTDPGVYIYTVHEADGGVDGWTYDTASYVITITVTASDGILFSDVAITKNGTDREEIVFVNTYDDTPTDETIIISGKKTWKHGNNPENKRPTSIIVEVYADGELAVQRQINAEVDNWRYNFEVPKYAEDGHEIVYTIDEAYVKDYSKTVDGYDITNTYVGKPDEPDKPVDPPDSPETGDNSMLTLWFTLVNISGIGIVVAIIYRRRNRRWRERL